MNRITMGSVVALMLAAGACRNNEPPSRTPEPPPAPSIKTPGASLGVPDTAAGSGQGSLASSSDQMTSETTGRSLTDHQILYVLHAANLSEMDQARIAQTRAQNGRVKRFAATMLEDHGEADAKGHEVAKKTQASLAPSETSERLERDAKQLSSKMAAELGSEFDRSYIDAQVKQHRAVLQSIDRELLPAVRSTEIKELLQIVRVKVEGHLSEAEQIQKGLAGG